MVAILADYIFKCILLNDDANFLIQILLKIVPWSLQLTVI